MKRDIRIDVLRSLGIILIMLAHVRPPESIFHLRSFDVPLMSMLLGMSFVISSSRRKGKLDYKEYIKKRFKRLVIPTWVFITLYLTIFVITSMVLNEDFPFTPITVFSSYFLIPGISYIWIIRVFFTISILSPFLLFFSKRINSLFKKTLILLSAFIVQYILCLITYSLNGAAQLLFEELIAISFGYVILAVIGMWAVNQNMKENFFLGTFSIAGFVILGINNGFIPLNDVKYPPTPYFLMYGIGISLLLLVGLSTNKAERFFNNDFIIWSSKHSLELYYWHAFPVVFLSVLIPDLHFVLKFVFVLLSTYFVTYLQLKFIPGFFNLDLSINRVSLTNSK